MYTKLRGGKTMKPLKPKEQKVLDYITKYIETEGFSPTVREICRALDISSTAAVFYILRRLEEKGHIITSNKKSRTIRLASKENTSESESLRVPLLSKVSGGPSALAIENIDGYVDFPKIMGEGRANLFALRVIGNDMAASGILNGDIVIIESGKHFTSGLVAAEQDGSVVIGYASHNGKDTVLKRAQDSDSSDQIPYVSILGRIIADYRFY